MMDGHQFDPLSDLTALEGADGFIARHVAPNETEITAMLAAVGASSLDDLATRTVPVLSMPLMSVIMMRRSAPSAPASAAAAVSALMLYVLPSSSQPSEDTTGM